MTEYQIVNTVCAENTEKETAKRTAAIALYAELLKYCDLKKAQKTA